MERLKVLVIGVGGTIASIRTEEGLKPGIGIREIVKKTFEGRIPGWLELEYLDLMKVDSSLMTPEHYVNIAEAIYKNYSSYDAFLVLHGTDTMAYAASALSFALRGLDKPVILTGSMKSVEEKDSDAPRNVADSLAFARAAHQRKLSGVYIVFNGKAILGVRASKIDAVGYNAFESLNYPPVAEIKGEEVSVIRMPRRSIANSQLRLEGDFEDRILVLKAFPGMRSDIIDAALNIGIRGLVIEAFGLGGLPQDLINKLGEVSKKIPVVVTGQPVYGGVNLKVYEVGNKLLQAGVIPACDMTKESTIMKLMWALKKTSDVNCVKLILMTNFEDEIDPQKCGNQILEQIRALHNYNECMK